MHTNVVRDGPDTERRELWSREQELADRLTPDEQTSLAALDLGPMRSRIPFSFAEWLIGMGLAEVLFGRLEPAAPGKQLLAKPYR